jgi:hypothetical protein
MLEPEGYEQKEARQALDLTFAERLESGGERQIRRMG